MNKKINLILLLLIAGVLLVVGCSQISKQTPEQKTPNNQVPQNYETLYVSLGEKFTLHKNQSAIMENENYEIKITKFFNSPCPKEALCVWSGIGIAFEYTYNGEVQKGTNLFQAFGYKTTIIDTDYETYAELKITKME